MARVLRSLREGTCRWLCEEEVLAMVSIKSSGGLSLGHLHADIHLNGYGHIFLPMQTLEPHVHQHVLIGHTLKGNALIFCFGGPPSLLLSAFRTAEAVNPLYSATNSSMQVI